MLVVAAWNVFPIHSLISVGGLSGVKAGLAEVFNQYSGGANVSSSDAVTTQRILGQSTHQFEGGNDKFHKSPTVQDKDLFEQWRLSLIQQPIMLSYEMDSIAINYLVEMIEPGKGEVCYEALEKFLGGKFHIQSQAEEAAEKRKKEQEEQEEQEKQEEQVTR